MDGREYTKAMQVSDVPSLKTKSPTSQITQEYSYAKLMMTLILCSIYNYR